MGISELLMESSKSEDKLDLILANLDKRKLHSGSPDGNINDYPDIPVEDLILKTLSHGERTMLLIPRLLAIENVNYNYLLDAVEDNPALKLKLYGVFQIASRLLRKDGLKEKAEEIDNYKNRLGIVPERIDNSVYNLFKRSYNMYKKYPFSVYLYETTGKGR